MKQLFLAAFFILALAGPAQAETARIGGTAVEYAVPAGYVLASGEAYALNYEFLRRTFKDELVLHALYVPQELDRRVDGLGHTIHHIHVFRSAGRCRGGRL